MALTFGGKRRPGGTGPRQPLDPLEQRVTDRIAAVLRALAASVDVDAYANAIRELDPDLLNRLLSEVRVGRLSDHIEGVLREVLISGASQEGLRIIRETPLPGPSPLAALSPTGRQLDNGIYLPGPDLPPPPEIGFRIGEDFDRTPEGRLRNSGMLDYIDTRATEYARTRAASLVVEVDESNRRAIRQVIHDSFVRPVTVDDTARRLRSVVGLHSRWANAVIRYDDRTFRSLLSTGMDTDTARARTEILAKRYRDRLIRRRAEMIARTEIMQASNAARYMAWDAGSKTGYVDARSKKRWVAAPHGSRYGEPCPVCQENAGTEVPWNGTFQSGHSMPPAHPHCRCTATLIPPSRGLEGLPSQDMDAWLERLDAMDAEEFAKHLAGQHDQSSHGRRGGVAVAERPDVSPSDIARAFEGDYVTDSGFAFTLTTHTKETQQIGSGDGMVSAAAAGGYIEVAGERVGEWARAVHDDTMYALFLTVGKTIHGRDSTSTVAVAAQGRGIALTIQKRTEEVARQMGLSTIRVSAHSDGTAAWANERFGYRFTKRPELRSATLTGAKPDVRQREIPIGEVKHRDGVPYLRGHDGLIYPGWTHPDLTRPDVQQRILDLRSRLGSDDPDDWPAPHEILNVGTGLRVDSDVIENRTAGEFLLSWGWEGAKPSSHVTKALGGVMRVVVLGDQEPVVKHLPGQHDQQSHGRKGGSGMRINPGDPSKGEEQHIEYDGLYVPTGIPVLDGSSVDNSRIDNYRPLINAASSEFAYWDGNYATRVVSARIMGIEGGFKPRGEGAGNEAVEEFLAGRRSESTLDPFQRPVAQDRIRSAVMLLDAAGNGKERQQLWRGIRLRDGDPRLSAKVGDEFEMPVTAFATLRADAEPFASQSVIGGLFPHKEHSRPLLIDVEAGARGHSTGPLDTPGGEEILVQGRFRVVAVPEPERLSRERLGGDYTERLTLRQVAHYDVISGEWVSDE